MSTEITLRGPLFHDAHQLLTELETELTATLSKAAEQGVHTNLSRSLQHPSGHYQAHVQVLHHGPAEDQVTDQGIVYGPWLEGVSSRNQSTRFKGYASFRRATQAVNARAVELCEPVVEQIVRRFNR